MFDLFSPGSAQTLVLLMARVGGLVLVAPMFSAQMVPASLKTALTLLLAILLQPVAFAQLHGVVPAITPATFLGEALVGFALGLGAAVLVGAANVAGDVMAIQIGLSGAALMDPTNNESQSALGTFAGLFAVTLMLAVNGHVVMIEAVAESVRAIPIGAALHAEGLRAMVRGADVLFALGLQFAAPVAAAVLVANTALAILSRAAPQLNILSVAFPVQIGIGLMALGITVPFIGAFYNGWSGVYHGMLDNVFLAFAHGAP